MLQLKGAEDIKSGSLSYSRKLQTKQRLAGSQEMENMNSIESKI